MNCLDCRRTLLTDPRVRDQRLIAHLHECASCARFSDDQTLFEQHLERALRVPTPENLRERLVFATRLHRRGRGRWIAVAAIVLLGVGIGLGGWEYTTAQRLASDLVAQMAGNAANQSATDATTAERELQRLLSTLGARLDTHGLGRIVAAGWLDIDGRRSGRFVIERGGERATVFLLPGRWLALAHEVKRGKLHGVLITTDKGVIALFCPDRRMIAELAEDMRAAIQWQA